MIYLLVLINTLVIHFTMAYLLCFINSWLENGAVIMYGLNSNSNSVKEIKERQKEMVNTMKQSLNDALSMLNVVMTTMSRMERGTKPSRMERGTKPVDLPINPAPAINEDHSNNP